MLARLRNAKENGESGFTLIELLVVMIIIGILAAIAIPAFLNQKKKARDTSAKADVSTIGKEVAAFYVDGTGGLALSGGTATTAGDWTLTLPSTTNNGVTTPGATVATGKLSFGNVATGTITSDTAWCVQVDPGTNGSRVFSYSAANGLKSNACNAATN